MTTVAQVAAAMQTVLTQVADEAGQSSGFIQRQGKVTGALFVQMLVFGWLGNAQASLEQLTQSGASVGLAITPQGLDQRFTEAAARCLRQVLEAAVGQVLRAAAVDMPLLKRFTAVHVLDSTCLRLPEALASVWTGCGGRTATSPQAMLKLQVDWDLLSGALHALELHPGRTHDRATAAQQTALPAGALRVADLGYWDLDVLQTLAAADSYWLSRLQLGTRLFTAQGQAVDDWPRWLSDQGQTELDVAVQLGAQHRLPARLLAMRVPPTVAERRRRQLKAEARRRQQGLSARRLALADWTLVVTNVPVALLSLSAAMALLRARWQIELLFKLWKDHGRLDEWRSAKPWRILCEVYAKLLALMVQHWVLLTRTWADPARSLRKAAQTVAAHARQLAVAYRRGPVALSEVLTLMGDCLAGSCRINKRRAQPATFQLLLAAAPLS